MKKFLAFFLAFVLLLFWMPVSASAETSEVASGTCGDNLTWVLTDDGTLTISGTGAMKDYQTYTKVPWHKYRDSIVRVVLEEGVTNLGDYAFYPAYNLTEVSLPESLERIGIVALASTSLSYIYIPSGVTEIGPEAFEGNSGLAYFSVSEDNTAFSSDESGVLFNKDKTTLLRCPQSYDGAYVIPDTVTFVGEKAFDHCHDLTEVTVSGSVKELSRHAFACCTALETVHLREGLEVIGNEVFFICSSLKGSLTIPASVTKIGASSFDMTELTEIRFLGDMPEIDVCAFAGVDMTVYYPGNNATWTEEKIEAIKGLCTWVPYNVLEITRQPVSVTVAEGEKVTIDFEVTGDGLTYKWFFKNAGAEAFTYTSSFSGKTYSVTMNDARNGRQVYCVVTDKYGNSAQTDTVTMIMGTTLQVTKQPQDVAVAEGETVKVSFTATGDGLTYKWYYKNAGASSFTHTASFSGNTYRTTMNAARNGRQIYCVVTDKYGNSVTTDTVTLSMATPLEITRQPQSVVVAEGETAKVSFTATGDGLTYKWYYKNAGATKFSYTSTFSGNTYTATMNDSRNGRQIYCVVTDKYGNSVTTDTVTLHMGTALKITQQPQNAVAAEGKTAKVSFTAVGDGLTYKWYYKNAGATKFSYTSTFSGNTYTATMNDSRNGRQIYCVVTDKYGNSVTTDTVTLHMGTALKITRQPQNVVAAEGETVTINFEVTGDGLTYKWYYKNAGASKFSYTSTFSGNTYTATMSEARNGRQVYCVITDKYGNTVTTDTVTMTMTVD